jgi:6-phospho-beta-glucosidase
VLAEQISGHKRARAEEVMAIERTLLEMYADPRLDKRPDLLMQRGGAYYSEAAAQLIASLHAGTGDLQAVDIRNQGALPDLADDAVVEIPARIDRAGAHGQPLQPLHSEMAGLIQQVKAYERLTVAAAIHGDRRAALKALMANPLVRTFRTAEALLGALLDANREHLPRFYGAG